MGRVVGKVALITGAARGQGRSHAVRLAEEGADIIAVDICGQIDTVAYPMGTVEDLAETARLVEATGRRVVARPADVRDYDALERVVRDGAAELGGLDIVCANAGICAVDADELDPRQAFRDVVEVDLFGVWNTLHISTQIMTDLGRGGSIVITSSTAGLKGIGIAKQGGMQGYTAAKHGVIGLMRVFAVEYAPNSIRVNTVHPTGVNTPMANSESMARVFEKHVQMEGHLTNALPVSMVESIDITNAVLYLVSDEGRYVTGVALPVDAGATIK